jgi:hypothetical protein
MEGDALLVGIGCNLTTSPTVDKFGLESGREATCLMDIISATSASSSPSPPSELPADLYFHRDGLASLITTRLSAWLLAKDDTDEKVIADCSSKLSYLPQRLRLERVRGSPLTETEAATISAMGDEVWPVRLNADGTLQVLHRRTNQEMTLAADYLW